MYVCVCIHMAYAALADGIVMTEVEGRDVI